MMQQQWGKEKRDGTLESIFKSHESERFQFKTLHQRIDSASIYTPSGAEFKKRKQLYA